MAEDDAAQESWLLRWETVARKIALESSSNSGYHRNNAHEGRVEVSSMGCVLFGCAQVIVLSYFLYLPIKLLCSKVEKKRKRGKWRRTPHTYLYVHENYESVKDHGADSTFI
jgi:hypothetical protein